jgi:hypothetical protein
MRRGWNAFRSGLSQAARYRGMLLILLLVNLASALPLVALPAMGLGDVFGQRPAIQQAADGMDPWLVVETLMAPLSSAALGEDAWPHLTRRLQQVSLLGLLTIMILPALAWLSASFLNGGVLLTYTDAVRPDTPGDILQRFRWRRFLWGCWHWFGAFLLLGAAQATVSLLVFVPLTGLALVAIALFGGWLAWALVPLLALLAVFWLAWVECTRIAAVVEGTRNVARAFGRAARFLFRHLLAAAGLYASALVLLGLLHALYHWGIMPHLALHWWPLVFVVQQAFILARLWARLARLAGGVALYQG